MIYYAAIDDIHFILYKDSIVVMNNLMTRTFYFVILKTWKINSPIRFLEEKQPNNQLTDSPSSMLTTNTVEIVIVNKNIK